ncbi:MAG: Zn-ribbon domain-containing OB-fold protein [Firmicutes bacterium]|nr:Zn-ribbon domain-containing OB-fold protein [Bacillota bacterium]
MGAHISIPNYQRSVGARYRLEAQKCKKCGIINFPPKGVCIACGDSNEFELVQLSGKGTIYSYTIISGGGAPPEFAEEAVVRGSYPVAVVELAEGPKVIAQMVDAKREDLEIGKPVEMVTRKIYTEEGVIRYGYKFRPASG